MASSPCASRAGERSATTSSRSPRTAAAKTDFYLPSETRRGPDGLLYIMDFNNMRLRRIDANGTVTTVAGNGIHADAMASPTRSIRRSRTRSTSTSSPTVGSC